MKRAKALVSSVFKLFILVVTQKVSKDILLKQIFTKSENMTSQFDSILCD